MRFLSIALMMALLLSSTTVRATCTFGFLSPVEYPANEKAGDLTTGDFNKDGYLDVAVQNRTMHKISILFGTAGGGLASPVPIATEYAQGDIQAGHFNSDTNLDLVMTVPWSVGVDESNFVKVFLGTGTGTFNIVPYDYQHTDNFIYQNPWKMALGDFNNDGKTDLAASKANGMWSSMLNFTGRFRQKAEYRPSSSSLSTGTAIASGDFDGDGKVDVALAEWLTGDLVYLYYGVGDGTFTLGSTPINLAIQGAPARQNFDLGAGDFNGDGKDDLAMIGRNRNGVATPLPPLQIALSNGTQRTFAAPVGYGEVEWANELAVRDMDGDGKLDVVVSDEDVKVFRGNGDGSFAAALPFGTGTIAPLGLAIGDFDRDGGPDIIVSEFGSGEVAIFLNTCGRVGLNLTSSANPVSQGTSVTVTGTVVPPASVAPTGTITLKNGGAILNSGNLTGGTSLQATLSDLVPGTYTIGAEYSGDSRFVPASTTLQQVVTVPPFGPPPGLNAISYGGPVQLAWLATMSTDHYEVWRNNGAGWVFAGNAAGASYTDNVAPASAALLYKVRAIAPGGAASGFSAIDLALTYSFTDGTLTPGVTRAKLAHLTELRSASNAVRAVSGLGPTTWADASPTTIRASHLTELRGAINAARAALGLQPVSYSDPGLAAGTSIKALHFEQLRGAMR